MVQDAIPGVPPGFAPEWLSQEFSASYSGPLPLPEHLRQYNELVPGAAKDIIDTVYLAPERRQQQALESVTKTAARGQGWAIFFMLGCFVMAAIFFATGNMIAGGAFMGPPLIALIRILLPHRDKG